VLEFKRLLDKARSGAQATRPSVDRSGTRGRLPEEDALQLLIRVNDDIRSWKDWIFWDEEGILFGEMVHFIDLAMWFNHAHPVRAFVEGSPRGNFTIVLRFSDGSITTMQHSMVGNFDYPKELVEATLRNITIAMDQHIEIRQCGLAGEPNQTLFPYAQESSWATSLGMTGYMAELAAEQKRAAKSGEPARWLTVNKGHAEHLDRFLTHLESRGNNPCDVEDAVSVNRVALKLLESARLGMPVAVNPEDWHVPSM
jgi:predicted dehydrogenase